MENDNADAAPDTAYTLDGELVAVFGTQQESEAMVVRSLLQSAGIEALMGSLEAPQDVLPGVGGVVVRVRAEQAEEARRMIAEFRQSAADDDDPEPAR